MSSKVCYLVRWPVATKGSCAFRWYDKEDRDLAEKCFAGACETAAEMAAQFGQWTIWSQSTVQLIEFRLPSHLTMADFLNGYQVTRKLIRSAEFSLRVERLGDDSPVIQDIVDRLIQAEDALDAVGGIISNDDRLSGSLQRSLEAHVDDAVGSIMGIVTDYAQIQSPGRWVVTDAV